ncbi:Nucleoporin GLE1 [Tolypocladium paradoxum]|uniref:mRNA export factor GLE1 n=1 Tax=Tolypocladium paradoxum TaxID=94208 RepID=A0A2S4L0P9_9HYPO|nr:Nucleoporin GLE1 [Tolypocladium paradoxum]
MTRSSPLRSQLLSSPDRGPRSSFLFDDRNTELSHRDALLAAQAEHERVRAAAIRVFEMHELKEVHQRILDQGRREQERLRAEAEIAAEDRRLQELKAKTIRRPPPPVAPEPPTEVEQPASQRLAVQPSPEVKKSVQVNTTLSQVKSQPASAAPQQNGLFTGQGKPAASSTFAAAAQQQPASQQVGAPKPSVAATQPKATPPQPATTQTQPQARPPPAKPIVDRYIQIHQELKTLRKDLMAQSKVPGSPLKGELGAFRREIRVSIGQLTGGKGANIQPTTKIMSILRESLEGRVPSPPIDPSRFVAEPRQPAEGAAHNDATLPALFIYLMNICAKGIISQFINEAGANPKAADPIGVFTAQIFSNKDFQWRGQSLIDILLAKFRVVCPVLFGFRGNDRTERGRQAIGWRKDGPTWITEQSHNDRMAGLGAGFASVALRDFSKTSKANPFPPTHYWKAFAGIVNSPANETSNTQYVVLRSMIDGHEQRFLNFYGNAAVAALRLALVDFPKKAPQNASAAGTLVALAEVLRTEGGLVLA